MSRPAAKTGPLDLTRGGHNRAADWPDTATGAIMFKPVRHTAAPALSMVAAVIAYGIVESIALLRSRTIDALTRLRRQLTGS